MKADSKKLVPVAGILLVVLFMGYQNYDFSPKDLADDSKLSDRMILPSLIESVGTIEDFHLKAKTGRGPSTLDQVPSVGMPSVQISSLGVSPGQNVEVEINGKTTSAFVYATKELVAGVKVSPSVATTLGLKIGDKIVLRKPSEGLPPISNKDH